MPVAASNHNPAEFATPRYPDEGSEAAPAGGSPARPLVLVQKLPRLFLAPACTHRLKDIA